MVLNTKTGRRTYWVQIPKPKAIEPLAIEKEKTKKKRVIREHDEKFSFGIKLKDIEKATKISKETGTPVTIGRSSSFALDGVPLTEKEGKRLAEWVKAHGWENEEDSAKANAIQKAEPSITKAEAKGLDFYLSGGFRKMNSVLRGDLKVDAEYLYAECQGLVVHGNSVEKESDLKNENLHEIDIYSICSKGAIQALDKLPPLSPESLASSLSKAKRYDAPPVESLQSGEDWNYHRDPQTGAVVGQGRVRRIIGVDDIDGFVQRYQEGQEVRDSGFVSTYVPVDGHKGIVRSIRRDGNVEFLIDWKKDETSGGKYIDHFKKINIELEVLFPPNTAFLVEKIERNENFDQDGKNKYGELRDELSDYNDEMKSLAEMMEDSEMEEYRKAFEEQMADIMERASAVSDQIAEYEYLYEMQLKVYLKEV